MKFDLSHFKKIKDDTHAAVLQHPEGHHIVVVKSVLSPKLKKQLDTLPMMGAQHLYTGGQANAEAGDDTDASGPDPRWGLGDMKGLGQDIAGELSKNRDPLAAWANQFKENYNNTADPADLGQTTPMGGQQASTGLGLANVQQGGPQNYDLGGNRSTGPEGMGGNAQTSNPGMQGMFGNVGQLAQDYGQEERGIRNRAKAEGELGGDQAIAARKYQSAIMNAQKKYTQDYGDLNTEVDRTIKDIKDQHINPNQYMENMSTGQRVSTAIGLILGGLGGGLAHTSNTAQDFLNKQIDRDIDAQKQELGKKNNLLTAYYHKYGNIRDAADMSRAVALGNMSAQFQEAAAKSKDPLAKARADQQIGPIELQKHQLLQGIAFRNNIMQQSQQPGGGGVDPAVAIQYTVDDKQRPAAFKELEMAKNRGDLKKKLLDAYDAAAQQNTIGNRAMHLGSEPAQVNRVRTLMMPLLKDEAGRINDAELEISNSNLPAMGDSKQKIDDKRSTFEQLIDSKMAAPVLDAHPWIKVQPPAGMGFNRRPSGKR